MKNNVDDDYELAIKIAKQAEDRMYGEASSTDELDNFFINNIHSEKLSKKLTQNDQIKTGIELYSTFDKDRSFVKFRSRIKAKQLKRLFLKRLVTTAAAVIVILSFVLYIDHKPEQSNTYFSVAKKYNFDTPHLILSNGSNINLDSSMKSIEEDNSIIKRDSIGISYITLKTVVEKENIAKYNTVIVPSGYTYSVVLEDSTSITLNANSELRYPLKFSKNERHVYLKGEAFFSVKKGNKPFIVESSNAIVRVYGTEFNIYNYENGVFEAILLKGSVGVTMRDKEEIMIQPNERLTFSAQSTKIESIIAQDYILWKDGKFNFIDQSVERILSDIGKWYNVKFSVPEHLKDRKMSMFSNKNAEINNIIKFIEEILNVKIINEGGGKYDIKITTI